MTAAWIKSVEHADVVDGKEYFIGYRPLNDMQPWMFQSIRGGFSTKPGIAQVAIGNQRLREQLAEHPKLAAIEVPADAHKRWKARILVKRRKL